MESVKITVPVAINLEITLTNTQDCTEEHLHKECELMARALEEDVQEFGIVVPFEELIEFLRKFTKDK